MRRKLRSIAVTLCAAIAFMCFAPQTSHAGWWPFGKKSAGDIDREAYAYMVHIWCKRPHGSHFHYPQASGAFVSRDGYVLTNEHVVSGASACQVSWHDKVYPAEITGMDWVPDLAVLKVEGENFPTMTLGDSRSAGSGDTVYLLGHPDDVNYLRHSIRNGMVMNREALLHLSPLHRFIPVYTGKYPGDSGGVLVDERGKVIGIGARGIESFPIGFFIPINEIRAPLIQLRKGDIVRGWIGLAVQDVQRVRHDPEVQDELRRKGISLPPAHVQDGVFITGFLKENSPAEHAGLKPGDIITVVNGHRIKSFPDYYSRIMNSPPGSTHVLMVLRGDEVKEIRVVTEKFEKPKQQR